MRDKLSTAAKEDDILARLTSLDVKYRTRTRDEIDQAGNVIERTLVQIVFWLENAVEDIQRWASGTLLIVDGTLNTNDLRFPLLIAVGKSNTEKTFPVAFSFCPGEDAASFCCLFETLREEIYTGDIADPGVVMIDQSSGAISTVDKHNALPNTELHYCTWHAQQAMLAKFRKVGYTSKELDGYIDHGHHTKSKVPGIKSLVWNYLLSDSINELIVNRELLLAELLEQDKKYVDINWRMKEERVIVAHVQKFSNLGQDATSRVEGFNRLFHKWTHSQMTLESSVQALMACWKQLRTEQREYEDKSIVNTATSLDVHMFQLLTSTITLEAITMIEKEWIVVINPKNPSPTLPAADAEIPDCDCELHTRWLLPCRHALQRAYLTGMPIPRTLVHPRWWICSSPYLGKHWKPYYIEHTPLVLSPRRRGLMGQLHTLVDTASHLQPEQAGRYHVQLQRIFTEATEIGERHMQLQQLPISTPSAIPRKVWVRLDPRVARNAREPTAHERAVRATQEMEATQRKRARDAVVLAKRANLQQEQEE